MPEVLNPEELKDWVKLAKYHKALWVESTERGDLTPTVFAERDGNVLCAVVSPQVDKELGLRAGAILRKALNADVITMIMDAHTYQSKKGEGEDEFMKKMEPGKLQRMCDEEGACETGLIADCLICHRIGKDKKIAMATIPYYYHGKGTTFRWLNDPEGFHEYIMDEHDPNVHLEGNVPHALRQIIALPSFNDDPLINALAHRMGIKGEKDRQLYHTTRAVYTALSQDGYAVFDYFGHNDPWEVFEKRLKKQ